jgi:hypothetical protein
VNSVTTARFRLADPPDESRSTATLIASLGARISMLTMISGAGAIGSLMSGLAALGRVMSRTAEGARLRRALESGRAGHNLDALWKALRIDTWASGVAPTPVIDHLRNDLALLLAPDLDQTLALLPIPGQPRGGTEEQDDVPANGLDCLMGLWFYSREITRAVEALATPTLPPAGEVVVTVRDDTDPDGRLLR